MIGRVVVELVEIHMVYMPFGQIDIGREQRAMLTFWRREPKHFSHYGPVNFYAPFEPVTYRPAREHKVTVTVPGSWRRHLPTARWQKIRDDGNPLVHYDSDDMRG